MSQQGTGAMAGEIKHAVKQDVDALRDDLGRLKKDVTGAARDIAGVARERVTEAVDTVKERGEETMDSAREAIRENPFAAIGIALGVGVLLGAMMRRL